MIESRRGRPRDPATRRAILAAAYELLEQGGIAAVTMEAVAERAGVGKPTVYRAWPNSAAVAMAALIEHDVPAKAPRVKSPLSALRRQIKSVARIFSTPIGRSVAIMLASSDSQTELSKSFRNHFIMARREEGRLLLNDAIAAKEIRSDVDIDAILDLLYGALFYRLIVAPTAIDDGYSDRILSLLLDGINRKSGSFGEM